MINTLPRILSQVGTAYAGLHRCLTEDELTRAWLPDMKNAIRNALDHLQEMDEFEYVYDAHNNDQLLLKLEHELINGLWAQAAYTVYQIERRMEWQIDEAEKGEE